MEPQVPPNISLILRTLLISICTLGLLGNTLCLIILFRQRMKSSFNYILIGLTYSDILVLSKTLLRALEGFGIIELYDQTWPTSVFIFLFSWIADIGTRYYIVAISVERYIAICHPLRARRYLTHKRCKMYAICVGIFVICLTIINYLVQVQFGLMSRGAFEIYKAVVLNVIPFVAIVTLNLFIYSGMNKLNREWQSRSRRRISGSPQRILSCQNLDKVSPPVQPDANANAEEALSITRMLMAVILVFGFCYSFECIRRILNFLDYFNNPGSKYHDYVINHLSDIFYVINSSVNFIIYCLLGKRFRTEFVSSVKEIVSKFKFCCCKTNINNHEESLQNVGGKRKERRVKKANEFESKSESTESVTITSTTVSEITLTISIPTISTNENPIVGVQVAKLG